jgi:hypothetical protein
MAAGDIYTKTPAGTAEVTNRKMKLAPRLRTMLILVDGVHPEFLLREEAEKVGAPADFLDQLLALQLIEKSGQVNAAAKVAAAAGSGDTAPAAAAADEFSRFRAAKDFMNVTVVDALGIKSFFFTLKLERAGTVNDLRGLADAYQAAIEKGSSREEAVVLVERLKVMLK